MNRDDVMQDKMKSGIYCIENLVNNKKYIGQSINIDYRWSKHKSELKNGNHDNDYLQKSYNKYGIDCFQFNVLEYCDKDKLDEREDYYINLYHTMDRAFGYNLKSGGQAHNHVCDEVRQKISESNKQAYKNSNLKQKRSQDALAQWADPCIKAKIIGVNNGMYGKTHNEEARKKISEARKIHTPVYCVELDHVFEDAYTAAKELEIKSGYILATCRGNQKTYKGYHWQFVNKNERINIS